MKSDNNHSWIQQSKYRWMKVYDKRVRGHITYNARVNLYEIQLQNSQGYDLTLPEIAKSLTNAKRQSDRMYGDWDRK